MIVKTSKRTLSLVPIAYESARIISPRAFRGLEKDCRVYSIRTGIAANGKILGRVITGPHGARLVERTRIRDFKTLNQALVAAQHD